MTMPVERLGAQLSTVSKELETKLDSIAEAQVAIVLVVEVDGVVHYVTNVDRAYRDYLIENIRAPKPGPFRSN